MENYVHNIITPKFSGFIINVNNLREVRKMQPFVK